MKFETRAIHAGQLPDPTTGAVIVPVYQTSTFAQDGLGVHKGYEYSRSGNPTRFALEQAVASLEEGKFGLAFASGLAATAAVLNLFQSGDNIVVGDDLYGGTYRLFEKVYKKFGITPTFVDFDDLAAFKKAIQPNTKMVWIETPTNPLLKLIDIQALAKITKKAGVLLAVDNTFASPYFQKPLLLGADIVVHSTTKYIAGHSDLIGGAIVVNNEEMYQQLKFYQNATGAVPGPWDCWLAIRGLRTLSVRMREHDHNGRYLAAFLNTHPKVKKVYYPGLTDHPQHKLAKKQMGGFGGMISIELKGGLKAVEAFVKELRIFRLGESLGGVESLMTYPAKMSHGSVPREERLARGITDEFLRISVGIENKEDLKEDLARALKAIGKRP
ncbi:MAG: cystathionine gamma-synthase [Candidatus Omnitrophica bacterium]|nr:cystathionine gamma-synthase [Candidatus Omnitrophota bacterium]